MNQAISSLLEATVEVLAAEHSPLCCPCGEGRVCPSLSAVAEIIGLCRGIFFPHYYPVHEHTTLEKGACFRTMTHHLHAVLATQINAVFAQQDGKEVDAEALAAQFVASLPELRRILLTDVEAAYLGDPSSESYDEVICCYPAIKALMNHRVAHELHRLGIPLLPRIIAEMAHSETGIDIHPAAQIGEYFTIDHGTGVVIGATCIIGHHVKLYQGVTLGARSFPLDQDGNPVKGIPRHPILGNHVIVYSNATVLGRITIGDHVTIGGQPMADTRCPPPYPCETIQPRQ